MFEKIEIKSDILYRGEIPFFLGNNKNSLVYLCSSKKNINDYYWLLKDIYDGVIIKSEEGSEEEYINFNFKIIEAMNKGKKFVVLTTLEFFTKSYRYSGNRLILEKGENISLNSLKDKLLESNYEKVYLIESKNQFSIRGDIIDFYPISSDLPIRVELFDTEIERITNFDIESQKSIKVLENIDVYIDKNKEEHSNFLELFSSNKEYERKIDYYLENREILNYKIEEIILDSTDEKEILKIRLEKALEKFLFKEIKTKKFSQEAFLRYQDYNEVKKISQSKEVYILSEEELRYKEIFKGYSNIKIFKYPLFEGFENSNIIYLTDRELKGIRVKREKKQKIEIKHHDISSIHPGDYIIHENFGVGVFVGFYLINDEEFLEIRYAGDDKLFVPTNNLDRIEKFVAEPGKEPEIYKIGRKGFKKRREKLKEDMLIFAKEIVEIQAKRSLNSGYAFSRDTLLQEEFEDGFPYNLTPDQHKAIESVKKDMESSKVMDRIICGDVGCGKTEVAIRAAFKAAMDEKQVVLMVPTTVLAQQHFERFKERLKNYPITIELLSRLKSDKEVRDCLKKVASGGIDIVIGTHKVIGKEVKYKDLGLVIIDEEQKFGVKVKEKLKKLKDSVDMLTLTATPIPRTLNLALLGIRDISIIETLPPNRVPIQDFFIENKENLVRDAIMREFSREGQSFYIFNSVKKIEKKEEELRKILPSFIRISHIHGQMQPKEIREKLYEFESGEIDLLISTTIIENGIDVENANTIIIEGIEKLGLSQMYQLRGRVGRGSERGYCYLIVDNERSEKAKSKMREESFRTLSDLGAGTGFHLSLEDMRIRGAGEILGDKQHGAIEILGYGLYLKLLQEEMAKIKGEWHEPLQYIKISLLGERSIPEWYIEKEEKVIIYKRVSNMRTLSEIQDLIDELVDRFGKMPIEVENFFRGEKLRIMASKENIVSLIEKEEGCYIKFGNSEIDIDKIMKLIGSGRAKQIKESGELLYKGKIEEYILGM